MRSGAKAISTDCGPPVEKWTKDSTCSPDMKDNTALNLQNEDGFTACR